MAEPEGTELQRKMTFAFYTALLVGGILLFWVWGVLYNIWYPFTKGNIAIYVVYMPMIAFGIIGMLLYRKKSPQAQ